MLAAYLCHSWKPQHLALNLAVWKRLSQRCQLLIDQPAQSMVDASPPWYISRIESLLRRSDVFVACIPAADKVTDPQRPGDWTLRCSPYMLFELRMAERANLPRFVLYDPRTLIHPPEIAGPHARYVPCQVSEVVNRLERGVEDVHLNDSLDEWLSWLERNVKPRVNSDQLEWASLIGEGDKVNNMLHVVSSAARAAGFGDAIELDSWRTDSELCHRLKSLSMLVADVTNPVLQPLHYFAHALLTPTVRINLDSDKGGTLPPLLTGHPAGYQEDLVQVDTEETCYNEVVSRASALVRPVTPMVDFAEARYELHQRLYKRHLVFISHNLNGDDRQLMTAIAECCRERGVDFWEYQERNRSGDNWKLNMQEALEGMTHFVPLFSATYEQSPMCMKELRAAISRQVIIRPFLLGDRTKPNEQVRELDSMHHPQLPSDQSPEQNGQIVVTSLVESVQR